MKLSKKEIALLIINLTLFVNITIITIDGVFNGASKGQMGENIQGIGYFKPYTIDSNVLLGIGALLLVVFLLLKAFKQKDIPKWINVFYYVCTTSITLTMLTVIFFLFPISLINNGLNVALFLFIKDMFFFHALNPILALVSFFLLKNCKFTYKENLFAIIPMAIYSIIYLINVVAGNWMDFYGFTFGGKMNLIPIVLLVMYAVTYLIGLIVLKVKMKIDTK